MKQKITLKNIKAYIEGNIQMRLDGLGLKPLHYQEQKLPNILRMHPIIFHMQPYRFNAQEYLSKKVIETLEEKEAA
jgi:hypothetical protein